LIGEREVARIWQAAGFDLRNLEATGDHLVICANGVTIHSETKRAERLKLPEWLRQAADEAPQGTVPVVAFRQNRGEWYAALPLASLAELMRHAERDPLRAALAPMANAIRLGDAAHMTEYMEGRDWTALIDALAAK
jgi:hypothetical protein